MVLQLTENSSWVFIGYRQSSPGCRSLELGAKANGGITHGVVNCEAQGQAEISVIVEKVVDELD